MKPTKNDSRRCGWFMQHPALTACAAGLAVCLATLFAGERPAAAQEFTFHAEPAAIFFVDKPQSSRFKPGFYFALRPGIALGRVVALQWSYAMLMTQAKGPYTEDGSAHFVMAGIRLRPLATIQSASQQLGGLFVDFNLGYVRTDGLNRFGFDAGLGYGFQLAKWFSIGPVVRYGQIVQENGNAREDPNDAQFITVGLDLAFGPAHKDEPVYQEPARMECPAAVPCVQKTPAAPYSCPDRDRDGVCDADDRCPMDPGPAATLGCPIDPCGGKPLMVLVQFPYDSAELPRPLESNPQTMDPVLNAVAKAIAQDPTCRVCIVGHTSEEGTSEYNEDLSRRRAVAVQGYMTDRGLAVTRIPTTGLGERCQLVPEKSLQLNRRVEFLRLKDQESCPTDCSK